MSTITVSTDNKQYTAKTNLEELKQLLNQAQSRQEAEEIIKKFEVKLEVLSVTESGSKILSEDYTKIRVAKETEEGGEGELIAEITNELITPATGYVVIMTPTYD